MVQHHRARNVTYKLDASSSPGHAARRSAVFGVIHLLILLNSAASDRTCPAPLELLRSESAGEKPPEANWVLATLGR